MTRVAQDETPTPDIDLAQAVRLVPALRSISPASVSGLIRTATLHRYADGESVSAVGQNDATEFYVVVEGALTAACVDGASGSMIVERCETGEEFGLAAAVAAGAPEEGGKAGCTVLTADGETLVAAIETAELQSVLDADPALARSLLRHFAAKSVDRAIGMITPETSEGRRIHDAILKCAEVDQGEWRVRRMPRHRELAERARVEESVAAAAVATLISAGVARRDYPGLVIVDIDELRRLAG